MSDELNATIHEFVTWHSSHAKYRDATFMDVANKLGEECGEVHRALDRMKWGGTLDNEQCERLRQNLREEIGDVVACLATIAGRYFGMYDIERMVIDKMRDRMGKP